jgi:hypothetical protein
MILLYKKLNFKSEEYRKKLYNVRQLLSVKQEGNQQELNAQLKVEQE